MATFTKVRILSELNQTLDDCNLQTYAKLVRKHPLNEIRINSNVSREEIFNYLRRVPVEILVEVYEENFVDEDSEEDEIEDEDLDDGESEDYLEEEDESNEDSEEDDDESED